MRLSPKNFSHTQVTKQNIFTGQRSLWDRFSYETKNAIFDVDINADWSDIVYQKNCSICQKEPIHYRILEYAETLRKLGQTRKGGN